MHAKDLLSELFEDRPCLWRDAKEGGLPLYAVCVVILYVIGAAFGIKPYAFPPPQRALRETMHQLYPRQKEMKFK